MYNSLTFSVQPFKWQVSAAAITVFNFSVHCGTLFSLVNAKDVHLTGHLPVRLLKVKIHFNAMYTSCCLIK